MVLDHPVVQIIDMIFVVRRIEEKCREQHQKIFMAFIDLTKAFDFVNREALWMILARYGCPPKFITVLRLLHDGMIATVLCRATEIDLFSIRTAVKQGCVAAPTLFSIFLALVLILVHDHLPSGVVIEYRMDGQLYNLRRFRSKA